MKFSRLGYNFKVEDVLCRYVLALAGEENLILLFTYFANLKVEAY